MTRKKISTSAGNTGVIELEEGERLVEETHVTKRYGKEKKQPEPEAMPIKAFTEIEPDEDVIDVDDIEDDETPEYSENSLAALIYDEDGASRLAGQFCTINIRRNPDSLNDKFRKPCGAVTNLPPLRNIELTADRMDIEDKVRNENASGGHYFFQIFQNGRLSKSWSATLSDPLDVPDRDYSNAAATTMPPAVQSPPAVAVDPFKQMVEQIAMMKQLRDGLFGDEQKRMEDKISELQAKLESREETTTAPQSDLALAVSLLKANNVNDPGIVDFIKDQLNPSEKEPSMSIWDFMKYLGDNADKIVPVAIPLLTSLFPGLAGGPSPQMPPPGMPQQIPPPAFPPPPPMQSMFAPRTPEPPTPEPPDQFDTVVSVLVDSGHLQIPNYSTDDVPEGLVAVRGDVGEGEQSIVAEPTPPKKRGPRRLTKDEEPDNSNAIDAEEKTA